MDMEPLMVLIQRINRVVEEVNHSGKYSTSHDRHDSRDDHREEMMLEFALGFAFFAVLVGCGLLVEGTKKRCSGRVLNAIFEHHLVNRYRFTPGKATWVPILVDEPRMVTCRDRKSKLSASPREWPGAFDAHSIC
jgi:hypothetical protein